MKEQSIGEFEEQIPYHLNTTATGFRVEPVGMANPSEFCFRPKLVFDIKRDGIRYEHEP